jgi:hypothetical protein
MPISNRTPAQSSWSWSTVRRIFAALSVSALAVSLSLAYTLLTLKSSSKAPQRAEIPIEKTRYAYAHNGKSTTTALELKHPARHEHSTASRLQ